MCVSTEEMTELTSGLKDLGRNFAKHDDILNHATEKLVCGILNDNYGLSSESVLNSRIDKLNGGKKL